MNKPVLHIPDHFIKEVLFENTDYNTTMINADDINNDNISTTTSEPTQFSTAAITDDNVTVPVVPVIECHWCQYILYKDIADSNVRYWDLCILIPNIIFLLFLAVGFRVAIVKLKRTSSPIFLAFYGLIVLVSVISVLRCVVSMTVNASIKAADIADQVLWLVLRFFLLATELSVVIFGLAFGHLDSKTSIQRVLLVTFTTSLLYSATQGVLEFMYPDDRFHVKTPDQEYDIFGHGGMLFWFASSVFFFVIYAVICILPFTNIRQRFALPTKRAFYWYCGFLAVLNLIQAIGSGLLHYDYMHGMCVVDLTTFTYFTCFAPLVYFTFLREFFRTSHPPSILFSYKAHIDEDDDNVNLPHSSSSVTNPSELRDVVDYNTSDFTENNLSPNPLYDTGDNAIRIRPQLAINTDYFDGPEDV